MEKGIKSKRRILDVAFKLFAAYSYPDVSYSLLEEASGISRGSMVYYFGNKEGIFRAVLETFLFKMGNVNSVPEEKRSNLCDFFNAYVDSLEADCESLRSFNIPNINEARFNIERSALQFTPDFKERETNAQKEAVDIWRKVLLESIKKGDLRADIDVETTALLLNAASRGYLYTSIYNYDTYSLKNLRKTYEYIYSLLKA